MQQDKALKLNTTDGSGNFNFAHSNTLTVEKHFHVDGTKTLKCLIDKLQWTIATDYTKFT